MYVFSSQKSSLCSIFKLRRSEDISSNHNHQIEALSEIGAGLQQIARCCVLRTLI